jgi:hypothetical protein
MSAPRRGVPSKAEKTRRKQLKKAAAREDEYRRQMEARIAQGLVKTIPWADAVIRSLAGEAIPDDVLILASPLSPAKQFLRDKMNSVSVKQFDVAWRQAMIDLLKAHDIPLDWQTRWHIAAEMEKLLYPEKAKRIRERAKVQHVKEYVEELERRGYSQAEAYDQIAEEVGHKSGAALRKWMKAHDL